MKITSELRQTNFDLWFEPNEPITTPHEFTDELLAWANREGHDITILRESDDLEPVVELAGVQYLCKLGDRSGPASRAIKFPPYFVANPFDYKWVYLYKIGV